MHDCPGHHESEQLGVLLLWPDHEKSTNLRLPAPLPNRDCRRRWLPRTSGRLFDQSSDSCSQFSISSATRFNIDSRSSDMAKIISITCSAPCRFLIAGSSFLLG